MNSYSAEYTVIVYNFANTNTQVQYLHFNANTDVANIHIT